MNSPDHPLDCTGRALANRFGALAHPARLDILMRLSARDCCCKDVVGGLDLAQSTVSQHLKVLVNAGLVTMIPHGQRSIYRIDNKAMSELAASFARLAEDCCAPGRDGCGN